MTEFAPSTETKLRELGTILTYLAEAAQRSEGRADGMRFVSELKKALDGFPGLFTAARALADRAGLGVLVEDRLKATWDEVEGLRSEITEAERLIRELGPALTELESVRTEHTELTTRIAEVRRLEALRGEVETLRGARRDLARRLAQLSDVETAELDLTKEAEAVTASAALRIAELKTETRQVIEEAERLTEQIGDEGHRLEAQRSKTVLLESDLAALEGEFAELKALADATVPQIEAHRAADRELCDALGAESGTGEPMLGRLRTELDAMGERLGRIDEALRQILRGHDAEYAKERADVSLIPSQA